MTIAKGRYEADRIPKVGTATFEQAMWNASLLGVSNHYKKGLKDG